MIRIDRYLKTKMLGIPAKLLPSHASARFEPGRNVYAKVLEHPRRYAFVRPNWARPEPHAVLYLGPHFARRFFIRRRGSPMKGLSDGQLEDLVCALWITINAPNRLREWRIAIASGLVANMQALHMMVSRLYHHVEVKKREVFASSETYPFARYGEAT